MANYYTNFSGSTYGSTVTGWSPAGAGVLEFKYWPSPGTRSLNNSEAWLRSIYTDVYGSYTGFSMDAASADTSSPDCDVLVSARFPMNLSEYNCGVFARGSSGGIDNAYAALIAMSSTGATLYLCRIVLTSFVPLVSAPLSIDPSLTNAVHYKLRLRCQGTTISATAWPRNATEPSPQLSVTDPNLSAAGYIGVIAINGGPTSGKVGMAVEAFAASIGSAAATFGDTLPSDPEDLRDVTAKAMTVYNYPSASMQAISGGTMSATERQTANALQAMQLRTLIVGRGRIDKRDQLAWTYTLDGHDYYILRLGDDRTLIYDLSTGEWADWGETEVKTDGTLNYDGRWRLASGTNWRGLGSMADELGSDVVAGDDTFGTLHVLDPLYELDYQASIEGGRPFERRVQGVLTVGGRDSYQLWGVRLMGAIGEQTDPSLNTVELLSSDTIGHSYFSHGQRPLQEGQYNVRIDWNSLGTVTNPGRLFKIIDYGALARIDALETYDAKS